MPERTPYPLLPTSGTIPDHLIPGRETEIVSLLKILRSHSVTVEEMRRMGKTLLLLKMAYMCNEGRLPESLQSYNFKARYISFQGRQDLGQVIELIIENLKEFKEWHQIDFGKTYKFLKDLMGSVKADVGGVALSVNLPELKTSWKQILFKTLDEIAEVQEKKSGILILIFDELPIMLWEWYKEGKHGDAMELLDILRERRQVLERKGIRFVYCGSIGIKVVLNTFRTEFGYTGEPTNEMSEFPLNPFGKADHDFLCRCILLSGFHVKEEPEAECFDLIYELTNGLPFYTSNLFSIIEMEYNAEVSVATISQAYDLLINTPRFHRAFRQLVERLNIYYPKSDADSMHKILTRLTKENDFIDEEALFVLVDIEDKTKYKDALYNLYSDHYLSRKVVAEKRTYKFKYQIFREWWKTNIA